MYVYYDIDVTYIDVDNIFTYFEDLYAFDSGCERCCVFILSLLSLIFERLILLY